MKSVTKRYRELEKLQAAARKPLPDVAVAWLAAVRKPLEKLTMAALSGEVSDAEFREMVVKFSASLPGLMETMDHDALGTALEASMGAAMANGMAARRLKDEGRSMKAKLPWEDDAWLAGRNYKRDADGKFSQTNGTRVADSRKSLRKRMTLSEKKKMDAPDTLKAEIIARYEKGVTVHSPTGRNVHFGKRAAIHLAEKEGNRARFADLAEKTAANPDEVWQDGLRVRYIKNPETGGRNKFLVVSRRISEGEEEVVTFTKRNPNRGNPPGKRIFPTGPLE